MLARISFSRFCFACGLLGAASLGCNSKPPGPAPGAAGKTTAAATTEDTRLVSAVKQLQPGHLGIDADLSLAVSVLNDWYRHAAHEDAAAIGMTEDSIQTLPKDWLTEDQSAQLLKTTFTPGDALYVRNAILTAAMARHATEKHNSELDRVVALFDFAMRTVMLQNPSLPQLPFPLYETLLLGQGTPDDRAWAFAALLKQQRVDAVILQAPDEPDARLVGVILDGEVYLFDTRLGLPIPRGDDPPSVRITRPATLKEMQTHPDWWQPLTLRADQPYPWNTEQLNAAQVFVYSAGESWNGRMKSLETVLPSKSACVLYDPLVDTSALPSLAKRISVGNAEWTPDRLKFWSHPLNLPERVTQMGQQVRQLGIMLERFRAPLEVVRTKKERGDLNREEHMGKANPFRDEAVFEADLKKAKIEASDWHSKTRIEQLMGNFADATTHFLRVRHLALESPPEPLQANPQFFQLWQQLYLAAAADASYWSATCKIEQGEDAAAAEALQDYLRKYTRSDWNSPARTLLALESARSNKLADARAAVAALSPNDPHRPGLEILMKRWDALDEAKPKSDEELKSSAPAEKENTEP